MQRRLHLCALICCESFIHTNLARRGLCCCDKQFCSLWVKRVLEWPLPHILSAHCLGGSTFGQHWDTIPCSAELQSFTIASLCRREPGTWPQPFPKLLTLCCGLQELLCPRPSRGASSPFYPKMQAASRRNTPLRAVVTESMGCMRPYDVRRVGRAVGWAGCEQQGKVQQLGSLAEQKVLMQDDFF